jgi:hypothetical protein
MASDDLIPQTTTPTFVPALDVPVEAQDEFDALQTQLGATEDDLDLIVPAAEPDPIGRTWVFDWGSRTFFNGGQARGPLEARGFISLQEWIRKCLLTEQGAQPIYPASFGLPASGIPRIGGPVGVVPPGVEDAIKQALLFHPWIVDVTDFEFAFDPDDTAVNVSFTVDLANGEDLSLTDLKLGPSVPV